MQSPFLIVWAAQKVIYTHHEYFATLKCYTYHTQRQVCRGAFYGNSPVRGHILSHWYKCQNAEYTFKTYPYIDIKRPKVPVSLEREADRLVINTKQLCSESV